MRIVALAGACALLVVGTAQAQMTPEQAAIVKEDPPFGGCPPALMHHNDSATGPARELFNGRDLTGWEPWLGYADPSLTFRGNPGATPLGTSVDPAQVYTVVTEDGRPAIRAGGVYWGGLATAEEFSGAYHLSFEYKWGPQIWPPSRPETRNNGLLYHSFGPPGAVFGTWRKSMEFQLQHGSVGMAIPLGSDVRAQIRVGQDLKLPYPHRRHMVTGRSVEVANGTPGWNVEGTRNAEKPVGQWNRIDLYVEGNRAIHVVNGEPVMQIDGLFVVGADGTRTPLDKGRIQLQSEGAETFFREIRIEPITMLPRIVVPMCK